MWLLVVDIIGNQEKHQLTDDDYVSHNADFIFCQKGCWYDLKSNRIIQSPI